MVEARVRRIGIRELVVLLAVLGAGWTLRWWHLGSASLWWDEFVHVAFASAPDPWSVFRYVQRGVPAGSGNAGAMPLDYVLLHLWLASVGRPPVEQMEAYYRFPSYVWSCATLALMWGYVRGTFGRLPAMVATLLLALSLPHVLYTAEARFYSLLMLMSVANLATFTWVLRRPESTRTWVAYGAVSILFFLTGMLSLLVLPWQFLALLVGAVRRRDHRFAPLAATGAVVVAVLCLYYATVGVGGRGVRPGAALLSAGPIVRQTVEFFTLGDRAHLALYGAGVLAALWYCLRRRRDLLPVVLPLLASTVATLPILVELLRWKRYYFHPRHVLFLLPGLELLAAVGLCAVLAAVAARLPGTPRLRRYVVAIAAVATVLALRAPAIRTFLMRPQPFFARIKPVRDMKGLVRDLRARTAFYGPGDKYLLVVDLIGPGHLANPILARYLQAYSLEKRVVLRSTTDMPGITEQLTAGCGGPCRGRPGEDVAKALFLRPPFEASRAKLRLLGLGPTLGDLSGTVRDAGVLHYAESSRRPDLSHSNVWAYAGMIVVEPR